MPNFPSTQWLENFIQYPEILSRKRSLYKGYPYYDLKNLGTSEEVIVKTEEPKISLTLEQIQKMLDQPDLFRECSNLDQIKNLL
jgi:hypothetical protein